MPCPPALPPTPPPAGQAGDPGAAGAPGRPQHSGPAGGGQGRRGRHGHRAGARAQRGVLGGRADAWWAARRLGRVSQGSWLLPPSPPPPLPPLPPLIPARSMGPPRTVWGHVVPAADHSACCPPNSSAAPLPTAGRCRPSVLLLPTAQGGVPSGRGAQRAGGTTPTHAATASTVMHVGSNPLSLPAAAAACDRMLSHMSASAAPRPSTSPTPAASCTATSSPPTS